LHQSAFTRRCSALLVASTLLALAGCGGGAYQTAQWDGRRGYDGNGDYGYDPDAPRKAAVFKAEAGQSYPAPGPSGNPWGPYLHEAAVRFTLPEVWLRAVMRQESGASRPARTVRSSPRAPAPWG